MARGLLLTHGMPDYYIDTLRTYGPTALKVVALLAALFVVALFVFAFWQARHPRVEHLTFTSSRVPSSLDGTRIVFIADIHAGPLYGPKRMDSLVSSVNDLDPDVLILGGDYVGGRTNGADIFYPAAAGFEARQGVYAVMGNHDEWEGGREARLRLGEAGIVLLENDSTRIEVDGQGLAIAGLADLMTGEPDIVDAADEIHDDDLAVLVTHNPDALADMLPESPAAFDLALAGHTHGGQVLGVYSILPHKPTDYGERYRTGWRTEHGTKILVSNGVGTVTLPLRFLANAQIHVIELQSS